MKLAKKTAGPGRPRSFDVSKALEKAMQVFWSKGYEGASVAELVEAMDITPPSLYAAFGNKEELFIRALEQYCIGPASYLISALNEKSARKVAERRLYQTIDAMLEPGRPAGCLVVQTLARCGDPSSNIGAAKKKISKRLTEAYVERFELAKSEGDLPESTNAWTLAKYLDAIAQGLCIQAASGSSREELLKVADLALQQLPA